MTIRCLRTAAVAVACLTPNLAGAQQAMVRTLSENPSEVGQAYLTRHAGRCFAIMPTHVMKEAGGISALISEGRAPAHGEARPLRDMGNDISVAEVSGGITHSCGDSFFTIARNVDRLVSENESGAIRSVNSDGSLGRIPVGMVDDDKTTFLRVKPMSPDSQLWKGLSGSLLSLNGKPAGMLLSIDTRLGVGNVYRLDRLLGVLDPVFYAIRDGGDAPGTIRGEFAGSEVAGRSASGLRLVSWTAPPIDETHRAVQLVAEAANIPPWAGLVEKFPVELVFSVKAGSTLSGLKIDGSGVADASRLPRQIEILVDTAGGGQWRSLLNKDLQAANETITFAPASVRGVMLRIWSVRGNGKIVSLRRVSAIFD
jgi:hypothetical protein